MRELDGRKLDHKTLEEMRIRAVKLVVEEGESPELVIKSFGFTRGRIYEWLAKYYEGGIEALKAKPLLGRLPKLTNEQKEWVYKTVTEKNPLELGFIFALWTRAMIGELIEEEFGIELSNSTVGRLLKKLGLSPQKPLRRAYQQDPEKVDKWLNEEYPEIKRLAKEKDATLCFGDESNVRSDYHSGTTWAPIGETPVIDATGARFGINLISAVSLMGSLRFMTFKDKMNSERFCEFLKRLIYKADRPVFLIVDNHPVHHSRKVMQFVEDSNGKLRIFHFPAYSPELNPDEQVWNNLKNHDIGKKFISGPDDLKKKVMSSLRSLQKLPAKIIAFFQHPELQYVN